MGVSPHHWFRKKGKCGSTLKHHMDDLVGEPWPVDNNGVLSLQRGALPVWGFWGNRRFFYVDVRFLVFRWWLLNIGENLWWAWAWAYFIYVSIKFMNLFLIDFVFVYKICSLRLTLLSENFHFRFHKNYCILIIYLII